MFIPLIVKTHYSLLQGMIKPKDLVKKCVEHNIKSCAITDNKVLSGSVNFFEECVKNDIKPIIGISVPLKDGDEDYVNLYSRNLNGWKELLHINAEAQLNGFVSINSVLKCNNLVCITGFYGSCINPLLISSIKDKMPVFVALNDKNNHIHSERTYYELAQKLASTLNIKTVDIPTIVYKDKEDQTDHLVLFSSHLKITSDEWNNIDNLEFNRYYNGDYSFSVTNDDMSEIDALFDNYNILSKPKYPKFSDNDAEMLVELAREGWRKRGFQSLDPDKKKVYADRVKQEIDVFSKAGIEGYFLIVQDYVNWCKKQGILIGPGRGCFLPDTRVKMSNGIMTPICDIKIGDSVIDAYGNTQNIENVLQYDVNEEILELEFENGKIIRCTKDHEFLTKEHGFVMAKDLTEEHEIVEI